LAQRSATGADAPFDRRPLEPPAADVIRGVAGPAARIVGDAANVLEEELAMGIAAAKKVEARLINVSQVRQSEDSLEVMRRFRRDAHEIVDILMDLISAATTAAQSVTQRLVTIQAGVSSEDLDGPRSVPILRLHNAQQGLASDLTMSIVNSGEAPTGVLAPSTTDLIGATGAALAADRVGFDPAELVIAPGGQDRVKITVRVPADARPGLYSGLLQVMGMEGLRAVLVVEVTPSEVPTPTTESRPEPGETPPPA
jgi:hypothetical protein